MTDAIKDYVGWGVGTAIGVASAGMVLRSMDSLVPRKKKKKKRPVYEIY